MNESQDEPRKLPEYVFKPVEPPEISQDMIEALNKAYESMWKSDFVIPKPVPDYESSFRVTFDKIRERSPCTEAQVAEKPKPGHLFIQLREGEEYATDHQEPI